MTSFYILKIYNIIKAVSSYNRNRLCKNCNRSCRAVSGFNGFTVVLLAVSERIL